MKLQTDRGDKKKRVGVSRPGQQIAREQKIGVKGKTGFGVGWRGSWAHGELNYLLNYPGGPQEDFPVGWNPLGLGNPIPIRNL